MGKQLLACGVVAVASMVALAGCGSSGSGADPYGAEPDYGEVQSRFDHPNGTFNGANAGNVLGNANRSNDANVGVFSGGSSSPSSGAATTKALRILGGDAHLACSDLQAGNHSGACACPNGGSFSYQIDGASSQGGGAGGSSDVTMKIRLEQCASQDVVVDGTEFLHMTSAKDASGAAQLRMLFVVQATVKKGAETHTLDLAEEIDNGSIRLAVRVDDGWVSVTIKASPGGGATYEVRDKDGSWTCNVQNGAGTCTSDKGGAPVNFKQ